MKKMRIKRPNIISAVEGKNILYYAIKSQQLGADIVELRLDSLLLLGWQTNEIISVTKKIREKVSLPLLATVRSVNEIGQKLNKFKQNRLSEEKRLAVFSKVIPYVDMVDIEINSNGMNDGIVKLAKQYNKTVIMSYHNFCHTPSNNELQRYADKSVKLGADIVKLAVQPNIMADVFRVLEFSKKWKKTRIMVILMGELGSVSRLIGTQYNSQFTYGYIDKPTGPGQFSIELLIKFYKLFEQDKREINSRATVVSRL